MTHRPGALPPIEQPLALLDRCRAVADAAVAARLAVLEALVAMLPTAAWRAAGARSAQDWIRACTPLGAAESRTLLGLARRCDEEPTLLDAVRSGALPLARAEVLGRIATDERAPFLAESLPALLRSSDRLHHDDDFLRLLRHWAERCDEQLAPRRVHDHRLHLVPSLFGGGELHGTLSPSAFHTVAAALDAFDEGPDPADAPHRRTVAERRADALDDLAHHALTHRCDGALGDAAEAPPADDWLDDDLDVQLDHPELEPLDRLRLRLARNEEAVRRRAHRRVAPRAAATVSVTIDLRSLAGRGGPADLDDLDIRSEGWHLATAAVDRFLCDARLGAVLLGGRREILDANPATEQFTALQRRAISARDGTCAFPTCRRPPKHCDVHHVEWGSRGGPTTTANGALCCRYHHRLIHESGWDLRRDDASGTWLAIDPGGRAHGPPGVVDEPAA